MGRFVLFCFRKLYYISHAQRIRWLQVRPRRPHQSHLHDYSLREAVKFLLNILRVNDLPIAYRRRPTLASQDCIKEKGLPIIFPRRQLSHQVLTILLLLSLSAHPILLLYNDFNMVLYKTRVTQDDFKEYGSELVGETVVIHLYGLDPSLTWFRVSYLVVVMRRRNQDTFPCQTLLLLTMSTKLAETMHPVHSRPTVSDVSLIRDNNGRSGRARRSKSL